MATRPLTSSAPHLVDNARTPVVLTRDAHPMHESEALEKALAMVAHLERELPLSVAAQVMGVSVETARSHLKRTFSKTGTNRQVELLRLISGSAPLRRAAK